ncbi:hypothetical protein TSUD_49490 [Trifolium subterraneum]|uniref:Aquaporin n=1 Tax=Trifolium subterraneum TaxID=3900 RepID=A0A2Z6P065_TRISU|nr:hypothetical protein TSUD_49490 [Trifolium subterraneum]
MDNEEIPSVPSTPATPGTPGAPLFGGFKSERTGGNASVVSRSKSLLKNLKCFSVQEWTLEDGALPNVSCSLPPPPVPLAKKVGAEFIGTFILMFAGIATAIVNQKIHNSETLIGCAGATGLAVPLYIGAQVLASICASYTLKGVFHPFMNGGVTVPSVEYGQAFALEFIISFNLMFVVTAVATDTRAYLDHSRHINSTQFS